MYIGLTGTIASGKSTIATLFERCGAHTIDLDILSKRLIERGTPAYHAIIDTFGTEILKEGNIDRRKLRDIVFNSSEKKKTLESILHPLIREEEEKIVNHIISKYKNPIIIVHAALLIETFSYKRFDLLIVIYADEAACLSRLIERDKISKELALLMLQSQLKTEKKIAYANFIIDNTRDIDYLKIEVERVYNMLLLLEKTKNILKKHNKIGATYYKST